MDGFKEGYSFAEKSSSLQYAVADANQYVLGIDHEIERMLEAMVALAERNPTKPNKTLGGDIAELWHAGTFNALAAAKGYADHADAIRSQGRGSADIVLKSGVRYGLKYYATDVDSAKAQAKSAFEEYKSNGGKKTLEEYLEMTGMSEDQALKDPLYAGQIRLIPDEQLANARAWLQRKVLEEAARGDGFEQKYQDALDYLADVDGHAIIDNGNGIVSRPLTKEQSTMLSQMAKENNIDPADWGITTDSFISFEDIIKGSLAAGTSAAIIDAVFKLAPEIYKAIEYLITTGEIDPESFKKIGIAAVSGAAQGFLIGSISYGLTVASTSGMLGTAFKSINPHVIGAVAILVYDTMGNATRVVLGDMSPRDMANAFVSESFLSACMLAGWTMVGSIWEPLGYLLGSFIGSVIGGFAYSTIKSAVLSLCVNTGFTAFGLVEQDYKLPDGILEKLGSDVIAPKKQTYKKQTYTKLANYQKSDYHRTTYKTIGITVLRRGVVGVSKIGYVY